MEPAAVVMTEIVPPVRPGPIADSDAAAPLTVSTLPVSAISPPCPVKPPFADIVCADVRSKGPPPGWAAKVAGVLDACNTIVPPDPRPVPFADILPVTLIPPVPLLVTEINPPSAFKRLPLAVRDPVFTGVMLLVVIVMVPVDVAMLLEVIEVAVRLPLSMETGPEAFMVPLMVTFPL
jgi:hypothetical protein